MKSLNPLRIYFSASFFPISAAVLGTNDLWRYGCNVFHANVAYWHKRGNFASFDLWPLHLTGPMFYACWTFRICCELKTPNTAVMLSHWRKKCWKKAICLYILPSFVSKGKSFLHLELESVLNVNFELEFCLNFDLWIWASIWYV